MSSEEIKDKITGLVEPLLEGYGLELVQLHYRAGRKGHLTIYIDKPGGVSLEDCETASRAVSELLDTYDPVPHSYVLEVSSPGIERPLTKESDYRRFEGEKVKVHTGEPIEGRKKFRGTLQGLDHGCVIILLEDGQRVDIPFSQVEKAQLWLAP